MITCTTMVLLILVEITLPILVLRVPCFFSVAVSAIYFFLALAAVFFLAVLVALPFAADFDFAFVFFLALLPVGVFVGVAAASPPASAAGWPLGCGTMPNSFSRITV